MKKEYFVIIIVILLLIFGFLEQNFINDTFDELNNQIIELKTSVIETSSDINITQNITKINNLKKFWEEKENLLTLLINNHEITQISIELVHLHNEIEYNNIELANKSIDQILDFVEDYQLITKINFQNVL